MKRQFSTALALSLAAAIQLGAADLYVIAGGSEDASCASIEEACDFQTGLYKARDNGQTNTIHVISGTYNISSPLGCDLWSGEDKALTIQRLGENPVILNGGNSSSIMTIDASYDSYDIDITIRGLTFLNGNGSLGGLFVDIGNKNITIEDSNFSGNTGSRGGGGIYFWGAGSATLTNNTFSNNISSEGGGGARVVADVVTLNNNTFNGNSTSFPGVDGGGVYVNSGNAILTNNTFSDNTVYHNGGGAYVYSGNAIMTNNTFSGNTADWGGGGAYARSDAGNVILRNNIFNDNLCLDSSHGGGVNVNTDGNVTLINNTFSNNRVLGMGGGVFIASFNITEKVELYNNIIWGNMASSRGDDLHIYSNWNSSENVTSVLLYNNDLGPDANFTSGKSESLYISDIENYTQANNLKVNPEFVDADNGDFHLTESSPLIDKGDLNAPALPEKDFEGDKRVIDGNSDGDALPDIGADEYNPPVKQADDIIEFIESGNLEATGPVKPAEKRMNALANKIDEAKQLIEDEDIDGACDQLESTLMLTDGDTTPPDWVAGDTAVDLANMIQDLMDSIGCPVQ